MNPIRSRATVRVALAAAVAAASASRAGAQEEGEPVAPPGASHLEREVELLVTATRREAESFQVPWSTDVVTRREMQDVRLRRTTPDALADLPGVMVQRTSYGQASPFLRGFTGYHTVLLTDGIRLNNSTFRSGPNQYWATVDVHSVERLEVVRGPSSVLYGSDAIGGTVNAVQRRRTSFEEGLHASVRSVLRLASAEDSWTWRVETEGNRDGFGWFAGATYASYGDLEAGHGTRVQDETGYRDADADFRVDLRPDACSTWTLGFQHVDQDAVPRTHKTVHGIEWHGTVAGDELRRDLYQTRDLLYLRHRRETEGPLADAFEITGSWQLQREAQVRDRDPVRSDVQGYDVDTYGFQAQAEKETGLGFLTYGAEAWHDRVESFRRDYENGDVVLERVQGPVADDAEYDLLGLYVQDEIAFGDTVVTAGVRYTYAAAEADRVDDPAVPGGDPRTPGNVISLDDSWDDVVGSLRVLQPLAPEWNLYGGVSQGFRAPNLSDLTRLDDTSGLETPSPGLDSEKFVSYEVGVKTRSERTAGQLSVWYTTIDDLIVPSPTGRLIGGTPEVRKDNVGDGWVAGVEAEVVHRLGDAWTVRLAGTWQDGEVDQLTPAGRKVREPLSRLMPLTGALTVGWREPASPLDAWVSLRAADEQDELSLKDATDDERIPPGGTPGYLVVSVGAGYEISPFARVSVALENVGNVDYRIHGSGVNEAGRNLVLALDLRF